MILFSNKLQLAFFLKAVACKYFNFIFLRKQALELYIIKTNLLTALKFMKINSVLSVKTLVDLVVIDFLKNKNRFKLVYNLLSSFGNRLSLVVFTNEVELCSSVTSMYRSAGWLEREAWDLYGIYFLNHGDLRRILTDYGFRGFPFRKDFPLTGYVELRFDDQKGDVVYEPVELTQEMRFFNFATGWEQD